MALKKGRKSDREIEDRRDEVMLYLSKGFTQKAIAESLDTTRQTINSDIKWLNKQANDKTNEMAKQGINAMYQSCIRCLNELLKECWTILWSNDPRTWNSNHKMQAIKLTKEITESKFAMVSAGPAMMHMNRLESEVDALKHGIDVGS